MVKHVSASPETRAGRSVPRAPASGLREPRASDSIREAGWLAHGSPLPDRVLNALGPRSLPSALLYRPETLLSSAKQLPRRALQRGRPHAAPSLGRLGARGTRRLVRS